MGTNYTAGTVDERRRRLLRYTAGAATLAATGTLSGLSRASTGDYASSDLVGSLRYYTAVYEDTLLDIARRYDLGFVELRAANPGVDPFLPGENRRILLPSMHILPDGPRSGVLVNLADLRLYFFGSGGQVHTFPLGVGREGRKTPLGRTTVVRKKKNPSWTPTANMRRLDPDLPAFMPPGPDNPLGTRALYLGWRAYLIHGTSKPDGVGRRVSSGCIRMYPWDVEWLFEQVPVGTQVTVVFQRKKLGWRNGHLYLESHPSPKQVDQIEVSGRADVEGDSWKSNPDPILVAAGDMSDRIDWRLVNAALDERAGIPVQITR